MALSKNHELGTFASGLDINQATGAVTSINIDTSTDDEDKKFRIINEYVPTKNLFFKKKL